MWKIINIIRMVMAVVGWFLLSWCFLFSVRPTRSTARALAKRLRAMLETGQHPNGVEVAVQNRAELDEDEYWVGTALCVVKEHDSSGTVGRVRFDPGDLEIEVPLQLAVWHHEICYWHGWVA